MLIESASSEAGQKAAIQRSFKRKLQEARYALELERTMTKDQILEGYLNIAYYGSGVYGIGTAANHYFGVPVSKLDLAQGALLAGMVQNPRKYDPSEHPGPSIIRRNIVLARMRELGYITAALLSRGVHEPLGLKVTKVAVAARRPA